jgi:hypothetical protein
VFALALALSVLIGVSLGLLGGGGSILTLPILIYALGLDEKTAIATSLVVVGVTSLTAMVSHARAHNVNARVGGVFAAAGATGAFAGGWAADLVPGPYLLRAFLLMMIATGVAMIRGRRAPSSPAADAPVDDARIAAAGLGVGLLTGPIGAGGGFMVVPALALLGGLPMPQAVGTSLMVIAINSFFGFLGHATHADVPWGLTIPITTAAVLGSIAGGLASPHVPAPLLRKGFGVFVLAMAVLIGWQQL